MKNQQGFTLIELVVVIVILGILAAVAVPKFIDMQVDARESAVEGMFGAVQSATALARAQALVKGKDVSAGSGQSIQMEGDTVDLVYGYPAAAEGGIDNTVSIKGFTYTAGTDTGVFSLDGAPTPASCSVTYTEATSTTPASSQITLTGC